MRYIEEVRERAIAPAESDEFDRTLNELAAFRYQLRKFLRFSEEAARAADVTPQQHQLMLGIAGFTGTGRATVSELAEFLQERHHSVVGLIDRAVLSGLVRRETDPSDRRVVVVSLTARGRSVLKKLSLEHQDEVNRLRDELLRFAKPRNARSASAPASEQISGKDNHPKTNRI